MIALSRKQNHVDVQADVWVLASVTIETTIVSAREI